MSNVYYFDVLTMLNKLVSLILVECTCSGILSTNLIILLDRSGLIMSNFAFLKQKKKEERKRE